LPGVELPEVPRSKAWLVFAKPAVHGSEKVLQYLGRYVHRTALGERALIASDERGVTFRYRDSRDQVRKTMTLAPSEFLRRFLQHVLPQGFHRVRTFGLLHPSHRAQLRQLQLLLTPKVQPRPQPAKPPRRAMTCPRCRKPELRLLRRLTPAECLTHRSVAQRSGPSVATARAPPHSAKRINYSAVAS
jgi:hypothetical protein